MFITLVVGAGFYLSPQNALTPADAIVVVSGGETDLRVAEGAKLFNEQWAPLMIMSGAARDEGTSNALMMRQLAIQAGVPAEAILLEEEAETTLENAQYVRDIVRNNHIGSIILVTSPYHQRRAYLSFRAFLGNDIQIINHSATDSAWRKNGWWEEQWGRYLTFSELQKIVYLPIFLHISKGE
ncbi:MAG: YdcF family protein [Patescibacteria group bacterium]|nr:YdcF family protein [Patescibacteria group bacterium]